MSNFHGETSTISVDDLVILGPGADPKLFPVDNHNLALAYREELSIVASKGVGDYVVRVFPKKNPTIEAIKSAPKTRLRGNIPRIDPWAGTPSDLGLVNPGKDWGKQFEKTRFWYFACSPNPSEGDFEKRRIRVGAQRIRENDPSFDEPIEDLGDLVIEGDDTYMIDMAPWQDDLGRERGEPVKAFFSRCEPGTHSPQHLAIGYMPNPWTIRDVRKLFDAEPNDKGVIEGPVPLMTNDSHNKQTIVAIDEAHGPSWTAEYTERTRHLRDPHRVDRFDPSNFVLSNIPRITPGRGAGHSAQCQRVFATHFMDITKPACWESRIIGIKVLTPETLTINQEQSPESFPKLLSAIR